MTPSSSHGAQRVSLVPVLEEWVTGSTLGGPANGLAADAVAVMIETLRIRRQDLEAALAGDRAALVERRAWWNTGSLLRVRRITPCLLRFFRFERRHGGERSDNSKWFERG